MEGENRLLKKTKHTTQTYNANHGRATFEDLVDDLKTDILCRLEVKLLARFAIVSKSWRRLIVMSCFPKLLHWPNPHCRVLAQQKGKQWLDYCNGLGLLRYYVNAMAKSQRVYKYTVLNPLINQYVSITKPSPKSSRWTHATLAYDPTESSYFKIVRFQGKKRLNIYSSENKRWSTYGFRLENRAIRAKWEKRAVYLKGAVYRPSKSGHVLRFVVDKKVNVTTQAQMIALPVNDKTSRSKLLGLNNGCINLGWSDGKIMKIWVLNHQSNDNMDDYAWCLKYNMPCLHAIPNANDRFRVFAFHPCLDYIFVGYKGEWMYGHQLREQRPVPAPFLILNFRRHIYRVSCMFMFPLLLCNIPFVSGRLDCAHS